MLDPRHLEGRRGPETLEKVWGYLSIAFFASCVILGVLGLWVAIASAETAAYTQTGNENGDASLNASQFFKTTYDWGAAEGLTAYRLDTKVVNKANETCQATLQARWRESAISYDASNQVLVSFTPYSTENVSFSWSGAQILSENGVALDILLVVVANDCSLIQAKTSNADVVANSYYYEEGASKDLVGTFYLDTIVDPENPVITIYDPEDEEGIAQDVINAVGPQAYYFKAISDIPSAAYPGETPDWELEIYDDLDQLDCRMEVLNTGNTPDGTNYGAFFNHWVDYAETPCGPFAQGDYYAQARARFDGFDWSDWSEQVDFSIGAYGYEPPYECPDDPSFFSACWFQNIIAFLFTPDDDSISGLYAAIGGISEKWPFSMFAEGTETMAAALEVEAIDLGEAEAGNPFDLDIPNAAWFAEGVKSFYGDWAGTAAAIFIWFGVLMMIFKDAFRFLNIETADDVDTTMSDTDIFTMR